MKPVKARVEGFRAKLREDKVKYEIYKRKDAVRKWQGMRFGMVFTIKLMLTTVVVFSKFWQWIVCLIY